MMIRLKFRKQGFLKFIGHLDVLRTFQKINRRAGIDIKYSAGFSPHQEMSFAAPLGLGLTSDGEYVDYVMNSVPGKDELVRRINAVNVEELAVLDACLLPDDAKNAMSILSAADYTLTFRPGHTPEDPERFYDRLFSFLSNPSIQVERSTKKNVIAVDLKSQIRKAGLRGDALLLQVDTGSKSNLKPEFVIETFCRAEGLPYDPLMFMVNRDELYGLQEGEEKPLIAFGRDF
ncbi:MAG: DUF2344 domain-containing protein [Lachnospiraceae bacterium]|nr:DUF2344 domain-containing protein [Lachnospiraceae bacterium]